MEKKKAIEIFNKWMDCKDAYQADPSCDGNCFSCEYYASAEEEKEAMQMAISALEKQEKALEQAFNEWCPDCKEYDKENHCCHRFTKVIRQTVEECKREWANEGWIPVTERLPKVHESGNSVSGIFMKSDPVLVYGTAEYEEEGQFHVVTYCDDLDGNTYWSTELDALTIKGVKAWRPLPENYTEEES